MNKRFFGPFLFGIGIIGMLDGIIFHQILQWHSVFMFTNRFNQIVSDGLFHLFVTVIIFIAGIFLWKSDATLLKPAYFWGVFLLGAGTFNFLEGVINHHLLQIHHVRPGPNQLYFDLLFDFVGILLIFSGWVLYKQSKEAQKRKHQPQPSTN